jgi:hypothetical protein
MNDETCRPARSAQPLAENNCCAGASAPASVLHLELERRPVAYSIAGSDADFERLRRWLDSHEDYRRLINEAIALGETA